MYSKFSWITFKASLYPAISFSFIFFGVVFSLMIFLSLVSVVFIPSIELLASVLWIFAISTSLPRSNGFLER